MCVCRCVENEVMFLKANSAVIWGGLKQEVRSVFSRLCDADVLPVSVEADTDHDITTHLTLT